MKLGVQIDSVVDAITNSSSELFICERKITVETARAILDRILGTYNGVTEKALEFSDVFSEPVVRHVDDPEDELSGWFDESDYSYKLPDFAKGTAVLIIESASDNTIPWTLFDLIEEVFGAKRMHLG